MINDDNHLCVLIINTLFYPVALRPNSGQGPLTHRFLGATQRRTTVVGLLWTSDQLLV